LAEVNRVVVVGAGPVGAVIALSLCQHGIGVTLVEAEEGPVEDQRAATVHPPTIDMLAELGLKDAGWETGLLSPLFHFRDRITGELVAEFDISLLEGEVPYPFVLQWEQYKLVLVALEKAKATGLLDMRFGTNFVGFEQDADSVRVSVEHDGETSIIEGAYLIGADGGRSVVRKLAGIEFEGFTWPERFIKIATTHNFQEGGNGYCTRNYFSDPEEWLNLFKVKGPGEPGIWRGIFPVPPEETDEEAISFEGLQRRLHKFLPKSGDYAIPYFGLYKVHQRVAKTFNLGRVLLAGDSAHVNNPIGGMGMNGGLHDAMNLAEKLVGIRDGRYGTEVLDRYTRQRRKAQVDFVQAQSVANKQALSERDPVKRREHLEGLRRISEDPALHKKFLRRSSLIDSLASANAVE
jgi:3-(3-hydroxy-phenyl)propionate hydroxylase